MDDINNESRQSTKALVKKWFFTLEAPMTDNWSTMTKEQQVKHFESQYRLLRDNIRNKLKTLDVFPQWKDFDQNFKEKLYECIRFLVKSIIPDKVLDSLIQDVLISKRTYTKNKPQKKISSKLNKQVRYGNKHFNYQ
jgi:hypothetical protein